MPPLIELWPFSLEELTTAAIATTFRIAEQEASDGNTAWTKAVKGAFAELAIQYGYKTLWTCKEPKCSEFMLDLVWWQQSTTMQSAVLGLESEWGNPWDFNRRKVENIVGAVDDEFWKLLCFKAPVKVLVYSAIDSEMRKAIHCSLQADIALFPHHVEGECYILMEFPPTPKTCYRYKYIVKSGDKLSTPQFEAMDEESQLALK
jgi:hypothetical protein